MQRFLYKIYNRSGNFVKILNDVVNTPEFTYSINGGLGEVVLELDRKVGDYGEGSDLDLNYKLEIYLNDDYNENTLIYTGYLTAFEPILKGGRESVRAIFLPNIAKLNNEFYRSGTSVKDDFNITHTDTRVGEIFKAILTNHRNLVSTMYISNDFSDIDAGNETDVITIEFKKLKHIDAIKLLEQYLDNGWFWYIDSAGKCHLKKISDTPDHLFVLGKHITEFEGYKNIEDVVNSYFIWNGENTDSAVDKHYSDATSQTAYDAISEVLIDSGIVSDSMSDIIGNAKIAKSKDPKRKVKMVISGKDYDIASIKPGDTCKILNIDANQTIFEANMTIVKISYIADSVAIELAELETDFTNFIRTQKLKETAITTINDAVTRANTGLNQDGYVQRTITGSVLPTDNPNPAGLYMTKNYIGYKEEGTDSGAWKVYIQNNGNFYFSGDENNYISWNGASLIVKGNINITGGSGISNLSDAGALATKDTANLDSDVVDGSTYKRTTANEKTGAGRAYNALDNNNALTTKVLPGSNIGTPSGSGLFLGADYLGYYSGSEWKAFIDSAGKFTFKGDSDNYISWDGSNFIVKGNIYNTGGEINAEYITTGELTSITVKTAESGARVQLDSTNYLQCIDSNGYTRVKLDTTALRFRDSANRDAGRIEGTYDTDWGNASMYYYGNIFNIYAESNWSAILALRYDNNAGSCAIEATATAVGGLDVGDLSLFADNCISLMPANYRVKVDGDIDPMGGNLYSLGDSTNYWTDVYATDGNFNHLKTRGGTEWLDTSQTEPRLKQNLICYTDEGKNLGDENHKFASVFQRYVRAHEIRDIPGNLIADISNQKMDLYRPLVLNSRSSYPSNPDTGEMFFHTILGKIVVYNGSQWETVSSSV